MGMDKEKIAIIGMAVNLPGAKKLDTFWANLCAGVDSTGAFPKRRAKELEGYVRACGESNCTYRPGGYINDLSSFDYNYFKITKKEAISMLPAQRIFLENVITALEDSGYGGKCWYGKRIGVYVGYIGNMELLSYQHIVGKMNAGVSATGTLSSNIAGRVSYYMNFTGESVLIDSACASSFGALHMACKALKNNECEAAIVGGVQVNVFPKQTGFSIGIESPDGHTRPFDELANGTGEAEGAVTIIIKRVDKAINDHDHIYGIIESITTNQDGKSLGLSAPNPLAQTSLVVQSIKAACIQSDDLDYLELHGTGTKLGDPIELNATKRALETCRNKKECYWNIGSLKANIGHTFAVSGIAGLVKCCLMMTHRKICPQINFSKFSQEFDNSDGVYKVAGDLMSWEEKERHICGISNFGFSGTNYHCIISEYIQSDKLRKRGLKKKSELFVLSAVTNYSLNQLVKQHLYYLLEHEETSLSDLCYTLSTGRGHYNYRLAIICKNIEELIAKLRDFNNMTKTEAGIYYAKSVRITDKRQVERFGELNMNALIQLNENVKEIVSEYKKTPNDFTIMRIAAAYIGGAVIDWEDMYDNEDRYKVSLPTYVFEKTCCWPLE